MLICETPRLLASQGGHGPQAPTSAVNGALRREPGQHECLRVLLATKVAARARPTRLGRGCEKSIAYRVRSYETKEGVGNLVLRITVAAPTCRQRMT